MPIIQLVISLVLLTIFYVRMIRREVPEPIGKKQAVVPVLLGIVSLIVSFAIMLVYFKVLRQIGWTSDLIKNPFAKAFVSAFLGAGLNEEIAKLLLILLCFKLFRPGNLYEHILIGFAVGMGFTLLEEFIYGGEGGGITVIIRLLAFALHVVFGIVMAKHLGMARYNRLNGTGSVAGENVLAVVIPILLHTLYDACTAFNPAVKMLDQVEDTAELSSGMAAFLVLTLAVILTAIVGQFIVLARVKKKAEKYSGMSCMI